MVDECGDCDGDGADVMCDDGSMVCDASECSTGGGDWDGDACTMTSNSLYMDTDGNVLFLSLIHI